MCSFSVGSVSGVGDCGGGVGICGGVGVGIGGGVGVGIGGGVGVGIGGGVGVGIGGGCGGMVLEVMMRWLGLRHSWLVLGHAVGLLVI
ncbi:hypothetical protein Tco_1228824 [Tanacetum coccineum]